MADDEVVEAVEEDEAEEAPASSGFVPSPFDQVGTVDTTRAGEANIAAVVPAFNLPEGGSSEEQIRQALEDVGASPTGEQVEDDGSGGAGPEASGEGAGKFPEVEEAEVDEAAEEDAGADAGDSSDDSADDSAGAGAEDEGAGDEAVTPEAPAAFDPGSHTVAEVITHVEANPGEREAVLAAEKAGKNRSTLVAALEVAPEA